MSDSLQRLAARLLSPAAAIRPRVASRFETAGIEPPIVDGAASEDTTPPSPSMRRLEPARALRLTPGEREFAERPAGTPAQSPQVPQSPQAPERHAPIEHGGQASSEPVASEPSPPGPPMRRSPAPVAASVVDEPIRLPPRQHRDETSRDAPLPPFTSANERAATPPVALVAPDAMQPAAPIEPRPRRPQAALLTAHLPQAAAGPAARHEEQLAASPTIVQVTIGSVEVRAPSPPARPQPAASRPAYAPRLSLQDYLQRRGTERGR